MSILDRFSLKERVALVTAGAGPLFGSSISQALAEAGAFMPMKVCPLSEVFG